MKRIDLLFALATAALITTILAGVIKTGASASRLNVCKRNLAEIGRACLQFAKEHNETLPGPTRDLGDHDFWWFYKEQVKSYAGINGPSDRKSTRLNSSH